MVLPAGAIGPRFSTMVVPRELPFEFNRGIYRFANAFLFHTVQPRLDRTVPGTGIGLAIARELLELHGAR